MNNEFNDQISDRATRSSGIYAHATDIQLNVEAVSAESFISDRFQQNRCQDLSLCDCWCSIPVVQYWIYLVLFCCHFLTTETNKSALGGNKVCRVCGDLHLVEQFMMIAGNKTPESGVS